MRQLATIQKIKEITPIEGKDLIVLLSFYKTGWRVIAQKTMEGVEKDGLVVYIEYDSILPEKEEFEFLRKRCFKKNVNGYRISVMKMGGVFSEGICFPLSILPEGDYKEGDDVTKKLGIEDYETILLKKAIKTKDLKTKGPWYKKLLWKYLPFIAIKIWGNNSGLQFPSQYAHKTDETRIQVFPDVINTHRGMDIYITEKMDGSSGTYVFDGKTFYICSRNLTVVKMPIAKAKDFYKDGFIFDDKRYYENIASKYNLPKKMEEFYKENKRPFAIQGEIVGPNAHDNYYKLKEHEFFLFDVYNSETRAYENLAGIKFVAEFLGVKPVHVIYEGALDFKELNDALNFAKGNSAIYPQYPQEGIVIRAQDPKVKGISGMVNDRFSLKIINDDYLLKTM